MTKTYNKLVRDRIPEYIQQTGKTCTSRVAERAEWHELLRAKLSEEVREYLEENDPMELADIVEVIRGLLLWHGMSDEDLEELRQEKYEERGGFEQAIVLLDVED